MTAGDVNQVEVVTAVDMNEVFEAGAVKEVTVVTAGDVNQVEAVMAVDVHCRVGSLVGEDSRVVEPNTSADVEVEKNPFDIEVVLEDSETIPFKMAAQSAAITTAEVVFI